MYNKLLAMLVIPVQGGGREGQTLAYWIASQPYLVNSILVKDLVSKNKVDSVLRNDTWCWPLSFTCLCIHMHAHPHTCSATHTCGHTHKRAHTEKIFNVNCRIIINKTRHYHKLLQCMWQWGHLSQWPVRESNPKRRHTVAPLWHSRICDHRPRKGPRDL